MLTNKLKRYTLLCLLLAINWSVNAQESFRIYGTVTDGSTGETLPQASVFMAETTYGVVTDPEGNFELIVPTEGTYDLIVRFVGFETYGLNLRLIDDKEIKLDVALQPEDRDLGSFTLMAQKDAQWRQNLETFKRLFLGTSKNADRSKILNEEAIDFYLDKKNNILYGFASEAIRIENKVLGYDIEYFLEEFYLDNRNNLTTYIGFTVFNEMEPRNNRQLRKWEEERTLAYKGSAHHFFVSLFSGIWEREGYQVQQAKDITSLGRVLDPSIVDLSKFMTYKGNGSAKSLKFSDFLYITYLNERESQRYKEYQGKFSGKRQEQVSWIELNPQSTEIVFDKAGYIYNPLSYYTFGYWGFEKVADLVPINYRPRQ